MTQTHWKRDDLVPEEVARFVAKWAHDRALPRDPAEALVLLTDGVVDQALHVGTKSLALELTWHDLDRVRAKVRLNGTSRHGVRLSRPNSDRVRLLDALADDWASGPSPHGWWEWFTVNTSTDTPATPDRSRAEAGTRGGLA